MKKKYKFQKNDVLIRRYRDGNKDEQLWICDGFYRFKEEQGENEYHIHSINRVAYSTAYESALSL